MAIHELSEEQTRTLTRAQKDRWWFENIFRGDLPQLTWRSAITGFILGGLLSATNLYIGGKSGVTLGVGLTSVILAFAMFKILSQIGLGSDFTILENNAMQSIATAAGYMTAPLISSLAALMLMTGEIIPWWQIILWNCVIATLGVLVAFPMKRRFINDDQLPFPEGRACGVVLDALYTNDASSGLFKARMLILAGAISGAWQFLISEGWMRLLQFKILQLGKFFENPWHLQENLDTYYYDFAAKYDTVWLPKVIKIFDTDIRDMGWRFGGEFSMVGVGGLMGLRTSTGVMIGAILNFLILGPLMISLGEIKQRTNAAGDLIALDRGEFVNQWGLWWPITAMVIGSVVGLFSKPEIITGTFKNLFKKKDKNATAEEDTLKNIELPLWVSFVGIPVFALLGAWMANSFFGANWWLVCASVPLAFLLSMIAANAMALTSWTPTGALSKISQFTLGALDRTNPATNLSIAGMTGEVAGNAANLLSDIKPGYMLGAKPRQQAIGHVIGIISGALASTPLFYLLFLPKQADGTRSVTTLISDRFGMPAAKQWEGVARFIEKGVGSLPTSVLIAMATAGILALIFEILRITTKNRFPLSGIAIGLGAVLPPQGCICMFAGALFFHILGAKNKEKGTRGNLLWVESLEPICAGLITGAALIGIGNMIIGAILD